MLYLVKIRKIKSLLSQSYVYLQRHVYEFCSKIISLLRFLIVFQRSETFFLYWNVNSSKCLMNFFLVWATLMFIESGCSLCCLRLIPVLDCSYRMDRINRHFLFIGWTSCILINFCCCLFLVPFWKMHSMLQVQVCRGTMIFPGFFLIVPYICLLFWCCSALSRQFSEHCL